VDKAVRSNYSCGTAIELEQASESLATLNRLAARFGFIGGIREQQLVAFTLMVAFAVIMRAELDQSPQQRALTEQNQFGEALLFDRANPAFRECVGTGIQMRRMVTLGIDVSG